MKLHKEFMVGRARGDVATQLDDPQTLEKLFPGTRIEERPDGSRVTFTPFKSLGQQREVRFVFHTLPDGNVRFEKVCDGNVWRSLDGEIHIVAVDDRMTSVAIAMEGQTRAFVPELTIRAPMREQIEQMAKILRAELERH